MSVRVETVGPVTTVVLARPERRNAVDGPTAIALVDAFQAFDLDPHASVAVLWGEGGNFCSGADLRALGTPQANPILPIAKDAAPSGPLIPAPMGPTRMRLRKPVIAAISGFAVAGGLELACWCDLRVAEENVTLGVFCRRWGVPLIDGGTVRLPRLIGQSRALDLILTGRPVGAAEALAIGLVHRLVPVGTARAHAEALALELSQLPQTCLQQDRQSVYDQWGLTEDQALQNEFACGLRSLSSPELVEGVAHFVAGAGRHGALQSLSIPPDTTRK